MTLTSNNAALQAKLKSKDGQDKLYQVIKALSAMRLCKEDAVPNAILNRRVNPAEGESVFVPALPTAEGSVSEIANAVPQAAHGVPCLF